MISRRSIVFVLSLFLCSSLYAEEWRKFSSPSGKTFVGKPLSLEGESVVMKRKKDGREFTLKLSRLSKKDQEWLKAWNVESQEKPESGKKTAPSEIFSDVDDSKLPKKLFPRTRAEITAGIDEIKKRKKDSSISDKQQESVTALNTYRFLCGLPFYEVVATTKKIYEAQQAVDTCEKEARTGRDLGSHTDKCNYMQGSPDMRKMPPVMITDAGTANRTQRGNRWTMLRPEMKEVGFAESKNYTAIWSMDKSGKPAKKNWAYPYKGYYPKEYLHGNGWSYYFPQVIGESDKDKIKVEVFQLSEIPMKAFKWSDPAPGEVREVVFVHAFQDTINFEPKDAKGDAIEGAGIYWVRIKGGRVKEQYVVALY